MAKRRITARKVGGDDVYSWAVIVDGHAVVTGLSKTEAAYHKRKVEELYNEKDRLTARRSYQGCRLPD